MMNFARPRSRDWWIPWSFVAFFGVMLVANGALIYFALESWTGIETRDAYTKGLAYNDRLAEAQAQAAEGWHTALNFEPRGGQAGRLAFQLTDRNGVALNAAEVVARVVRPTSEGHDFAVELPSLGEGRYAADVDFPLPGQWEIRLEATHPSGSFRLHKRIRVRP
jgi:nitrogen fixation protein FixH